MSSENTVNSQIVDSVSAASTLLVAQGPAQSFSMLDMVMLETLGTAMHNAVARQQGAGMVSNAAVTAACAKMINAPWPVPPPPPLPPPPPPPQVIPLPGPVPAPPSPAAVIAAATAEGKTAISVLQAQTHGATADAAAATASLHTLEQLAGDGAAPAPGPAPDSTPGPEPAAGPAHDPAPDSPSTAAAGGTDTTS
ncbi:TPA: RebB family R body protein [Stenotrophomonas maltophilia]|nr:RebB family R body protein [Stenotrophomonas maltophilia]